LREVTAGEVLGRIVSPYTHQVLEELTSPCDGWLVFLARSYPIRPGHWAFGVADASESEWITP
jgi:predicted deacylase